MAKDGATSFLIDFALGGFSGAVAKTLTAPIERIKLVVQTQDANPKIRSGEVPRYKGIVDCAARIYKEQGMRRFWDGNFTNCIRYFPTQAFNLAFKDTFKKMFPKYNPKTEFAKFFGANLVSGGLAAAGSLCIVYPLDYARTRLASDVGSGKKTFTGLGDCMYRTAMGPGGFGALYTGFGVSVVGIVGYRGLQLGTFDTITGINPWKKDKGILGAATTFAAAQTAITIGAGATYPFAPPTHGLAMADAASVPQGFARTLTQKSEAMLRGRDRWLERADEAMRRSEAALERHQAAVVGSLEAEAQARLHRDILPLLAPELRAYGRLTTLSVFGAGLLGKQSVDVAGRLAVQCCAGPEEEADGADSQGVPATEYYLRMFAQPVLEPFLEGMHEPLRTAVPLFLGAMAAYGASCLGLGFLLGRRQREK